MKIPRFIAFTVIIGIASFTVLLVNDAVTSLQGSVDLVSNLYRYEKIEPIPELVVEEAEEPLYKEVDAWITGYNSVPEQTDDTPCEGANGWICGRTDIVACPRAYEFGTQVEIWGSVYECQDRFNKRFEGLSFEHFDIFCGMDVDCPGEVTGNTVVKVRKLPQK